MLFLPEVTPGPRENLDAIADDAQVALNVRKQLEPIGAADQIHTRLYHKNITVEGKRGLNAQVVQVLGQRILKTRIFSADIDGEWVFFRKPFCCTGIHDKAILSV